MFRAGHRSSSGALNCICSLWFIYPCGDWPLPRIFPLSPGNVRSLHGYIYQRLQIQLKLLMMSGVPLETCWAFNKLWNNKFYYKATSCWYYYWVIYDARIHEYQILEVISYLRRHHQFVELNSSVHVYNTQRKRDIHIQSYKTDLYKRSVINMGSKLYNKLPYYIKEIESYKTFRKQLKSFLLRHAETSTWQHTTLTTDKYPCPRWDSNPRSQQASGRRLHMVAPYIYIYIYIYMTLVA